MTLVILLVASVVGAMVIIYIWSNTVQRTGHAVQIQSVAFVGNQTYVYVQNTGEGRVILEAVHLGDLRLVVRGENCTVDGDNTNIVDESDTAAIYINRGFVDKILIKIVCTDGTFYEAYFEP